MAEPDRPETVPALAPARFRALVGLFLLSGGAGLVDQVCFSKYLSYVVGATAHAVSAVLAAFMAGLAVGALVGGRLAGRVRRPLVAYAVAELLVAACVLATPAAFGALTPAYVSAARWAGGSLGLLSFCRWLATFVVVAVPTAALGATLPLVAASLVPAGAGPLGERLRELRLGHLYAANTLGGALGALGAAFVLLPAFGLPGTLRVAAAASALAGAVALLLARGEQSAPVAVPRGPALPDRPAPARVDLLADGRWLSALAFASGALVFLAEVVATHLLAVIVGNSAYAFGVILAAFLLCLFAGATLAPRLSRRFGDRALALSLGLAAIALAVTLPFWDELPLAFGNVGLHLETFEAREAHRALVAFAILALPATGMGLTFPLLLAWAARRAEVGALVGRLTALNTVGAVAGALGTGYVVLPLLGSEGSLLALAVVFAWLALVTALKLDRDQRRLPAAVAALAALLAFAHPTWSVEKLTAGTNVYFDAAHESRAVVVHVREDVHGGITTVTRSPEGVHTLYTNGKFQGNDGWELHAQRYFAHYPALFVPRFETALVIGLGTGTTLGTLTAYPFSTYDVVEISPPIVEAARRYFAGPNRGALDDPRVRLHLDDARNHLLVHPARHDLISMELSSVWFAGASSLYSREFYELLRERLAPGGVFQQWVQLHHIEVPVFARLVNTLRQSFEHVALFYGGGQGILVSSREPLRWSEARARELGASAELADVLPDGRKLHALTSDVLVVDEGLDRFIDSALGPGASASPRLVSTDDNLYLEYATPRGNVLPWATREALVRRLVEFRDAAAIGALRAP